MVNCDRELEVDANDNKEASEGMREEGWRESMSKLGTLSSHTTSERHERERDVGIICDNI